MKYEVVNSYQPLKPGVSASETSFGISLAALVLTFASMAVGCWLGVSSPVAMSAGMILAFLVYSVALETLFFPKTCALRQLKVRRTLSWKRVAFRETALLVTLAVIAVGFWLFPAFWNPEKTQFGSLFIETFYPFAEFWAGLLVIGGIPYFCLMDRLDPEEEDVLCRLGRALLTFRRTVTRFELANYARIWLVKAFFLAIMHPLMMLKVRQFMTDSWWSFANRPSNYLFWLGYDIFYILDATIATAGYALGFKLVNTQTRSADPTLLGWCAALFCYWPFCTMTMGPYFCDFLSCPTWRSLFPNCNSLAIAWGSLVILFGALMVFSDLSFCTRFSNLTYRGLVNTGLYRLTKHPCYVFKNLHWWFMYVPFLTNSGTAAIRYTLFLLLLNGVYYLRARTEERHLSQYPEYVAYALEMNEKSIFRWVARLLPFLKYRPPKDEELLFRAKA